jgi:cysteine desulfurase/selenocysteine lyase
MGRWESELRQRFPALRSWTYLNSAAAGPITLEVARAGCEVFESLLGGGDADWEAHLALVEEARALLAVLVGAQPREVGFTRNTSHGASLVAQMLWDDGRRTAVALEDEFPASTLPFLQRGFDVRFVKSVDGAYPPAHVGEALRGRDVLIASHVTYRTGHTIDPAAFGALAAAQDAAFLLCATQSLGALQVDFRASGAAYLVATSHKWLCAGYGGGQLVVRDDLLASRRWPQVGWLSQAHPEAMRNDRLEIVPETRAVEAGCQPSASLIALGRAVRQWLDWGPERVEARVRGLTKTLRERLRNAGFAVPTPPDAELSGITIVPVADAARVVEALHAERIATTARGAGVRVALHAFNDETDIDRLIEALGRLTAPE